MDRLLSHVFGEALGYIVYRNEDAYLKERFGCKKTTNELCVQLRQYQNTILPEPRLEDFIRYYYRPCDNNCSHFVPIEQAIPAVKHGIIEMGTLYSCNQVHSLVLYYTLHNRYPSESEFILYQTESALMFSFESFYQTAIRADRDDMARASVFNEPIPKDYGLETYVLKDTLKDDCCICQEPMKTGHKVITLPCFHTFHANTRDCDGIDKWLDKSPTCPLCKYELK